MSILGILGLTKYAKRIRYALVIVLLGIIFSLMWSRSSLKVDLLETRAAAELAANKATNDISLRDRQIKQLDAKYIATVKEAENEYLRASEIAKEYAKAQEDLYNLSVAHQETLAELDNYRGRLKNAMHKKPKLIERRANSAFANIMRKFETATSGTTGDNTGTRTVTGDN